MTLADLGKTVAKFAPLLGSVLGGPAGGAIGTLVASAFGGDVKQPDQLQKLITADPDALIKLRQIESDHQLQLQRLLLAHAETELKFDADERNSAREREVAVDQTPPASRDKTPAILAYMLTIGVFIALAALFYFPVPAVNQQVIFAIITSLTTVWIGAMGYYHGSSAGSRLKDHAHLEQLQTQKNLPSQTAPAK